MRIIRLAIIYLAIGVMAGILFATWFANRHRTDDTFREKQLQDSLKVMEVHLADLRERERVAVVTLQVSNRLLDSALARAPQVVYVTRTRTVTTPGSSDTAGTTTVLDSLPYIPKADYDTLASRCSVVQRDCRTALAAKDSVIGGLTAQVRGVTDLSDLYRGELTKLNRRSRLRTIRDVAVGVLVGGASAGLVCTVTR